MPIDVELPAQGEIEYLSVWAENPFEEDVFLEAVQMRPGNPAVVHHAGIFTRSCRPEPGWARIGCARAAS